MLKPITILFLTAVAIATPCSAWAWGTGLNDSEQPGSVIVFPKFIRGTVNVPDQGGVRPVTDFEVSVTCPGGGTTCPSFFIGIRFHWVCPGNTVSPVPCQEVDFTRFVTVKGTLHFNPENVDTLNTTVPTPPCPMGFLIGWVVNSLGQPIKFDALIGDAVIRESTTAAAAYNAIPIKAADTLMTFQTTDVNGNGKLDFDGNEYQGVSGTIFGNVRYDLPLFATNVSTSLTLLTLDVLSNLPNNPVYVNLNFYNEFETLHSTSTHFACWEEVALSQIDPGLTGNAPGWTLKGMVESTSAQKVGVFDSDPNTGPVTLLGIVMTREINPQTNQVTREYAYLLSHDSTSVNTAFQPAQ
jgi:hypothetical protein